MQNESFRSLDWLTNDLPSTCRIRPYLLPILYIYVKRHMEFSRYAKHGGGDIVAWLTNNWQAAG